MKLTPTTPVWAVFATSGWLALAGNAALWKRLSAEGTLSNVQGWLLLVAMVLIVWASLGALLSIFAWRRTFKPVATLLLLIAAFASYFSLAYGVVIDPGMVINAVQTDFHEATALASWPMAFTVLLLGVLPTVLLWAKPVAYAPWPRQLLTNLLFVVGALGMVISAGLASFQPLASVMRNHKEVRYLINPWASLYSAGRVAARPWQRGEGKLQPIGMDSRLRSANSDRPVLLLLVLGETARSANFSLNGYERTTAPQLATEGVVSFRNAWSCGTSTAASVPCMFSHLTREGFDAREGNHEGLLDVIQRAGLAVLWLDNQSGCKGVCDRVPNVNVIKEAAARGCDGAGCLDEVMLDGLDNRIQALDPVRAARGVVLVMHQMGSHGPAYYLRSPAAMKSFLPECTSAALQDCSRQSVVNAYDNSIAYTDHFLAKAIAWLKTREGRADTAMVYVSDHGESLGENNLYLHGLPYSVAPDFQKHVPWVTWTSASFQNRAGMSSSCLTALQDRKISHDHYFHSVLGLLEIETSVYKKELDVYASCRSHPGDISQANPAPDLRRAAMLADAPRL
ncbi:phosphoethanolamine--lipid A transferase [Caenimonas sedimenti]|uniref:Phosphoethanolamine--lipid A transferase n=1 Tax=Caenimonas sedimenti TaxID=2596921 RepID=A0A562ZHS4_9BURK|nr:phosphoethanolamine--lipid A transferase [Caenimonas sedimenti]TWO68063.1 phosphoethanolamine--lipid A transferase [Caenimonas sedimenti]